MKYFMKKLIAFILGCIMVVGGVISSFAAEPQLEEKTQSVENRELWNEIRDTLDTDEYGGIYVKNGELHIKPKNSEQVESLILEIAPNTRAASSIVIDEEAKYTVEELQEAMDNTIDIWDDFQLEHVALSAEYNGLLVGSSEWTEEKKDAFVEVVGMDHIVFEVTRDENIEQQSDEIERAGKAPKPGTLVENDAVRNKTDNAPLLSTISACVVGDFDGYVTTAHGQGVKKDQPNKEAIVEEGNLIYSDYRMGEVLGRIEKKVMEGSRGVDAVLIKKDDGAEMSNVFPLDKGTLVTEEVAFEGDRVNIFGGQEVIEGAIVRSTHCTKQWDNQLDDEGSDMWYNMIMMTTLKGTPRGGNSGGTVAVCVDSDLKYYGIVGVYKGHSLDSCDRSFYTDDMIDEEAVSAAERAATVYLYASNWGNVKRALGIDSIY